MQISDRTQTITYVAAFLIGVVLLAAFTCVFPISSRGALVPLLTHIAISGALYGLAKARE